MTRTPLKVVAAAGVAALALGLAACGSSSGSSAEAPATTTAATTTAATTATAPATTPATTAPTTSSKVVIDADPSGQLKWTKDTATAAAGKVTVEIKNDSPVPHNIAVEGNGVQSDVSDTVQNGGTADITVDLPAGTYTYYCDIPGHRQAGMEGTLTVK